MKCPKTVITTYVLLIAMAISLSNNLYAQVRPFNDECSEAIQIPVAPETSFNEFSLEGAQRSNFVVASTCGNDLHARDVWFTALMPNNGKLHIELSATKECPALTIYSGGCTSLGYLACDASKSVEPQKVINITEADLAGQKIYIRVHQENPGATNKFKIKVESRETQTVAVNNLDAWIEGKGIALDWKTLGELEVYFSMVQHSTDGINYQTIRSIEGRNTNTLEHYTYKHEQPQVGKNYYRIVMHMDSGEEFIFDEIEIMVDRYNATVRVFPNPTTEGVFLSMPDWIADASGQFTMMDMSGKIIQQYSLPITPAQEIFIDFSDKQISNGNYLVRLKQEEELIMNTQLSIQK